jgi:hypothetical protein
VSGTAGGSRPAAARDHCGRCGYTAVGQRGEEEGIGAVAIGAKIRNVLALFRPLVQAQVVEVRLHSTVLYNSIY